MPKISVIMSVYNGEKYLREAIESILKQSYSDFEFIIIDDGSTDGTKKILEEYTNIDKRIVFVCNEKNIGLTKSLNRGLKIAKGEYVDRMDSDDISHYDRFRYQVDFLDKNPEIGLLGSHISHIDKNGKEFEVRRTLLYHNEIKKMLVIGNTFGHGSVMIRKSCLDKIGLYREKFLYAQDYDLWLRIAENYKVANINKVLYMQRRSSKCLSRSKLSKQLDYHLLAIELLKERAQFGKDSLKEIKTINIKSILICRYNMTYAQIKNFKAGFFLNYCIEAIKSKDFLMALNLWLKSFILKPEKKKVKVLIKALLKIA